MKSIVIVCPTELRARVEWESFLTRWISCVKKAKKTDLSIEFLTGQKIYFKVDTPRALIGLTSKKYYIDEFIGEKEKDK